MKNTFIFLIIILVVSCNNESSVKENHDRNKKDTTIVHKSDSLIQESYRILEEGKELLDSINPESSKNDSLDNLFNKLDNEKKIDTSNVKTFNF